VGEWVVIDEFIHPTPTVWADAVSRVLGGTGISARSWSDYGEVVIQRFESGDEVGAQRIHVEVGPAKLDGAFLADLVAPGKRRDLSKARRVRVGETDDALVALCGRAGVPEPIDRYVDLNFYDPPTVLAFCKQKPAISRETMTTLETTMPTPTQVGFGTAVHVRGDVRRALIQAIASIYHRHAHVFANGAPATRRIFLVSEGGWCSFGELVGPNDARIDWGNELSRALDAPVLRVTARGAVVLEVFAAGARTARFVLDADPFDDTGLLGIFARGDSTSFQANDGGANAKLEALAVHLELPHPVLRGSLRGAVLPFVPAID
jgi:hypothetical protein